MTRKKGSARFTANISIAVTPEQKKELIDVGVTQGVSYSTVARWAIEEWLERNGSGVPVQSGA